MADLVSSMCIGCASNTTLAAKNSPTVNVGPRFELDTAVIWTQHETASQATDQSAGVDIDKEQVFEEYKETGNKKLTLTVYLLCALIR